MRHVGERRSFLLAMLAVTGLYALFQTIAWALFDVRVRTAAIPGDLALHLLVGALLWRASRSTVLFLGFAALLMAALHLGHAGKIAFYGGPLMPDDAASLPALLRIAEGPALAMLVAVLAGIVLLFLGNIAVRRRRSWAALGSLAALVLVVAMRPGPVVTALDGVTGHVDWDQRSNFERRGPALHLVQETARRLATDDGPPSAYRAIAAADRLLGTLERASLGVAARRNVHMIVLESFWDARQLTAAGLSDDPLHPDFRALWQAAGNSRILSPVFGGHTANAEFEALCGFPVTRDGVVFEGRLRRDVPCLPRVLAEAGYATVASHPNDAAFWNRINAYRRLGFETYWSAHDFMLDDMNEGFLSDSSLYRQVLAKTAPLLETGTPTFNYVLTIFGHVGYPLNETRPERIATNGEVWLVGPYVNTIRYKSEELMVFLDDLRARDPDALIVLFGDHLPFLGFNHGGYAESGLLVPDRAEFSAEMEVTVSAAPLIVIDGRAGPVALGDLPLYQLPGLVLDLLGHDGPTIMDYTRTPADLKVRPFPGYQLIHGATLDPALCRGEAGDADICPAVADWVTAVETVKRDLFRGRGSTVRGGGPWLPTAPELVTERPTPRR